MTTNEQANQHGLVGHIPTMSPSKPFQIPIKHSLEADSFADIKFSREVLDICRNAPMSKIALQEMVGKGPDLQC